MKLTAHFLQEVFITITDAKTKDNPEFLNSSVILLQNNPSMPFLLDLDFLVLKELKNVKIKISIEVYLNATHSQIQLVNQTVDMCKFLLNRASNWQVKLLFGSLEKYPNIPIECPIKAGLYYARNYTVELKFLPMRNVRAHKYFSTFELFTIANKRYHQLTQMKFDGSIVIKEL